MSQLLEKARKYEKENFVYVPENERPRFHVTGQVGWINDPNGFCFYKDEYHLFFQYHPYDTKWGPMHWGHVKSKDMVKWENLPLCLAPDKEYDRDGCFSGSSIELADGRHMLIFTGVSDGIQQQCIAFGDGINYEKYEDNPVIKSNAKDFRDPKIWKDNNGYHIIVAGKAEDESGILLRYDSKNAINWAYGGIMDRCQNEYGKIWECPDYFTLDSMDIILCSPMDMKVRGLEFINRHGTMAIIGKLNDCYEMKRESVQAIDYGLDFYAPQTMLTNDNRRIMIAWLQSWESANYNNENRHIYGMMTFPRELSIKEGRLYQLPVQELENYHDESISYDKIEISKPTSLTGINGRLLDFTVTVLNSKSKDFNNFTISIAEDKKYKTSIIFDRKSNTITLDRSLDGSAKDILAKRTFPIHTDNEILKLRLLIDYYSVEIFVNDGCEAASMQLFSDLKADGISFSSDGLAKLNIKSHKLLI